jgi:hypothetical protein
MGYAKWQTKDWKPKKFKYDWSTRENFTAASGLSVLVELFSDLEIYQDFKKCLPERLANNSYHTSHFALLLIAGFWMGYDCLDDMAEFAKNPVVIAQFGKVPVPKSFGDYLRDFKEEHIIALRNFLTVQSLFLRKAIKKNINSIIFDIDSTDHEHHGDTIEGLEINYKGKWCLDSLEIFDELGFCYDFLLRPGATFSSTGSVEMMGRVLAHRPLDPNVGCDYSRMDSAFCTEDMIRLCLLRKLKATITAHGRIGWEHEAEQITKWVPWVFTEEEVKKSLLQEVPLPKIEVGYYMYQPGFAEGKIELPVIVKRTFRPYERISHKKRAEMIKLGLDPRKGLWEHYAVLSLMGLYPKTPQEIMEHHQGRGNMENLIKEEKISFDLRHFPTKPIISNTAYALLGLIAHNFLRCISILTNPDAPQFAKALRRKFVHLPGKFVMNGKQRIIRLSEDSYKEVIKLKMRWAEIFNPPQNASSFYDKKAYRKSSLTTYNSG